MIDTARLIPEVYNNRSRDFQTVFNAAYKVILNYLKNNVTAVENLANNTVYDKKLLDLLCYTIGFKRAHEYNVDQLVALCSVFMLAIRNKGNIQSIQYILNVLANIAGVKSGCVTRYHEDTYILDVYLPEDITDASLFEDVINYIIPAGISYNIIRELPTEILHQLYVSNLHTIRWTVHHHAYKGLLRYYATFAEETADHGTDRNIVINAKSDSGQDWSAQAALFPGYEELNYLYPEVVGQLSIEEANFDLDSWAWKSEN